MFVEDHNYYKIHLFNPLQVWHFCPLIIDHFIVLPLLVLTDHQLSWSAGTGHWGWDLSSVYLVTDPFQGAPRNGVRVLCWVTWPNQTILCLFNCKKGFMASHDLLLAKL